MNIPLLTTAVGVAIGYAAGSFLKTDRGQALRDAAVGVITPTAANRQATQRRINRSGASTGPAISTTAAPGGIQGTGPKPGTLSDDASFLRGMSYDAPLETSYRYADTD